MGLSHFHMAMITNRNDFLFEISSKAFRSSDPVVFHRDQCECSLSVILLT
ncbi:hypothetical protein QE368_002622 [Asaia bogorensis NBRC 16594]|nr:hypothetical protein [Asaia bogorensis NBRC 16594]